MIRITNLDLDPDTYRDTGKTCLGGGTDLRLPHAWTELKPNSITLPGSKLVVDLQRAEIWPII